MFLRRDVYAARIADDIVLLDAGAGEYFCLAGAAQAFTFAPNGSVDVIDEDLASDAEALGLFGQSTALVDRDVPPVGRDLGADVPEIIRRGSLVPALASFCEIGLGYYRRPFPQIVQHVARHRRTDEPTMSSCLADHSRAFRALLPWAPFQGVCLYRSFFLLCFLRKHGLDAALVFGVRTWPFEAHCWLQADDVVLDDGVDYVRTFTPILAV